MAALTGTTTITNNSGDSRFFGYIPPHGRVLDDAESYTFPGILATMLKLRTDKNALNSLLQDIDDNVVTIAYDTGSGGGGQTSITYAALATAIDAEGLVPGAFYRITDFATVHYILDDVQQNWGIHTASPEVIVVQALTNSSLSPIAGSETYPQDILHYDWNPDNWLTDLSFADPDQPIIAGFKGVITYRHDTKNNVSCGYDFRGVVFRRWAATGIPAYSGIATYTSGTIVSHDGFLYYSLQDANTGHATDDSAWWVSLINVSTGMYICSNSGSDPFFTPDAADFSDMTTFAGAGYEDKVRNVRIEPFKDDNTIFFDTGTILINNVFLLYGTDSPLVVESVYLGLGTIFNTFCAATTELRTEGDFRLNRLTDNQNNWFKSTNCTSNIFGSSLSFNFFESRSFSNNVIGANANANVIHGVQVDTNVFGNGFQNNVINGPVLNLIAPAGFVANTIEVSNVPFGGDLRAATIVKNSYSKRIFTNPDNIAKLAYIDTDDSLTVVDPTT